MKRRLWDGGGWWWWWGGRRRPPLASYSGEGMKASMPVRVGGKGMERWGGEGGLSLSL